MKRCATIVAGLLPLLGLVTILVVANLGGGVAPAPVPTTTTMTAVLESATTKLQTTTTTGPELELRGQKRADVEAALRLVGQLDRNRQRRLLEENWRIYDCRAWCRVNDALAYTEHNGTCWTNIDTGQVRGMADNWEIPYLHWLAVTLVHEETHCDGTNERVALNAELDFERAWPQGTARTNAIEATRYGYTLLNKEGEWR